MSAASWAKPAILFAVVVAVVTLSFGLIVLYHEDSDSRIAFDLVSHEGNPTTQKDLAGKHLLVFFGFTSCHDICPMQLSKLSTVMTTLDATGHGQWVTPVFISVDPERDTVAKVADFLDYFHEDFVGLTGTRPALEAAADRFKTLLAEAPASPQEGYQVSHSSVIYVVDPFSRIIDFIPFDIQADAIVDKVKQIL